MSFTEAEKRKWHADRKAGRGEEDQVPSEACSHCGAPVAAWQQGSDFPLCDACDGD